MSNTQKRTGALKQHKLAQSGEPNQTSRTKTASTSKAVGLSEDMIRELEKDPDMQGLLRLHQNIQKVKTTNTDNSQRIKELKEMFSDLHEKITVVFKEQSNSQGAIIDTKKKDDPNKKK